MSSRLILDDVENALTRHHGAGDDPIHRAAIEHLAPTAREIAGAVTQRRVIPHPRGLQFAQMIECPAHRRPAWSDATWFGDSVVGDCVMRM